MMSHLRRWSLPALLLTLILTAPARHAGAAEAGEAKHSALNEAADARLARDGTVAVRGEPLESALRAVSEQFGVRLEAVREIGELKVALLAEGLPLRRVLAEMAELLDLTWSRRGTAGQYRYEAAHSQAATLRAQAALERARATNRAAVQAQLARVGEALRKGDMASLAATDPELAQVFNDPNRGGPARMMFQYLSQVPPEGVQELIQAGRISTNYDQMPPHVRDEVRRQTEANLPLVLGSIPRQGGNSLGYDQFLKSATYTLGLNGLDYGANTYYGEMRAGGMSLRFSIDLGIPAATAAAPSAPGAPGAVPGAATVRKTPRRPLPSFPATLEGGKTMSVREVLDWLAEKTPLAVVSDYYLTRYERRHIPMPAGASAEAAVAALEQYAAIDATLSDDGRVLRLRSRQWPLDDRMEPPPAALETLERALKANRRLGLSDYVFASQLTDAQAAGLGRISEAKYGQLGRSLAGSQGMLRDVLRLTGALPPAQRAAAESPAGLPVAQLAPGLRNAFIRTAMRQQPSLQPEQLARGVFRIRRQDRNTVTSAPGVTGLTPMEIYVFSLEFPGGTTLSTSLNVGPVARS